jgi:hypothetical protein
MISHLTAWALGLSGEQSPSCHRAAGGDHKSGATARSSTCYWAGRRASPTGEADNTRIPLPLYGPGAVGVVQLYRSGNK